MGQRIEYPLRVTYWPDGAYRWRARVDRAQRMKAIKITLGVVGALCLMLMVMAVIIGPDMLGVVGLSCLAAMAISGVVCWLYFRGSSDLHQPYEMAEEYIRYASSGRDDTYFFYKNIRRVTVREKENLIQVRGRLIGAPIIVPHEDFAFVQDYILRRLPPDADVRSE